MTVDLDLCYTPASVLARRILEGALSPVRVVENALERIGEINPRLNAFCFVYPDEALELAREAERKVASGEPLGPLHGVPVAIKDLTPTRGKRTTLGSHVYEHWVPDEDAVVVQRLKAAGAIMIGKTTTPEFAHAGTTSSPLWGVTSNPWDPDRTPGGSSGGSGVAVATGCVPLAEGTDMGGSVRIPAAFCGVVGLKPSLGRIPMDILPSGFDSLSHFGPLARTVEDAALFLSVTEGPHDRDPISQRDPLPLGDWPPAGVDGLKLALSVDLGYRAVHPDVEANLRAAAAVLRDQGAEVEEVEIGWSEDIELVWEEYWSVFLAAFFGQHLDEWRSRMDPDVVAYIEHGLKLGAVAYKRLEIARTGFWAKLAPVLERADALLCPTCAKPAPLHRGLTSYTADDMPGGVTMTCPFNLFGRLPVLSVPTGFTARGLPTAMQIVGRRFDDAGVLRIGHAVERGRPWADRRPPV